MYLKVPVVVGALDMIKKGTDKHINKIPDSLNIDEIEKTKKQKTKNKKKHFAELLISLEEYYQCDWKRGKKKQIRIITISLILSLG